MKIFLTHESQSPATALIANYRDKLSLKLDELMDSSPDSYGTDITTLCIISTCVSKNFLLDSGWKERIRYSKTDQTTDIRLNIDWERFIIADAKEQYNMYVDNIIMSIYRFGIKYPKLNFDYQKLICDIKTLCFCEPL